MLSIGSFKIDGCASLTVQFQGGKISVSTEDAGVIERFTPRWWQVTNKPSGKGVVPQAHMTLAEVRSWFSQHQCTELDVSSSDQCPRLRLCFPHGNQLVVEGRGLTLEEVLAWTKTNIRDDLPDAAGTQRAARSA